VPPARSIARMSEGSLTTVSAPVATRARTAPPVPSTLGAVLDDFAATAPGRSQSLDGDTERAVSAVLDGARNNIERIIGKET